VIARFCSAPANVHELAVVPDPASVHTGWLVGDRNYWAPRSCQDLRSAGVALLAPYRWVSRDPCPRRSAQRSRLRYRIDTVFGQLVDRCAVKRVRARDSWHLCSRLLRQILMQTLAVLLNSTAGNPSLQPSRLVA